MNKHFLRVSRLLMGIAAFWAWFLLWLVIVNCIDSGTGKVIIDANMFNEMIFEFYFLIIILIFISGGFFLEIINIVQEER